MSEIKDMMKLEDTVVENAAGGNDGCCGCGSTVCGLKSGYLAMRTQPNLTRSVAFTMVTAYRS